MRNSTPFLPQKLARLRCNEQGVQLVEVAIVLPVLLLLLAATAEFGRYFYVYSTLSRSTRTAIRHISSNAYTSTEWKKAMDLARCGVMRVSGSDPSPCTSDSLALSGLAESNFTITPAAESTYFPTTVTVEINYTYTPIFNLGNFASGGSWTSVPVRAKTTMRYMLTN